MMKNVFYFMLKALLVLKIFNFCFDLLVMKKKGLIRLISKFMTSKPGQQTIKIHIFSNISRSKEMKFSQLIEYNKRNICLQKSCKK